MSNQTLSQPITKESMTRTRNIYLAMIQIIDESIIPTKHVSNSNAIKDHCITMVKNVDSTIDKINEVESQIKASKAKNNKKPANKKTKKKTTKKKVTKKKAAKKKTAKKKTKAKLRAVK